MFSRAKTEPQRDLRRRLLPVSPCEFTVWANRIMDLADIARITREEQRYALARALLRLPAETAMETDEYFIFVLRKIAADMVALGICQAYVKEAIKRQEQEPEYKKPTIVH